MSDEVIGVGVARVWSNDAGPRESAMLVERLDDGTIVAHFDETVHVANGETIEFAFSVPMEYVSGLPPL